MSMSGMRNESTLLLYKKVGLSNLMKSCSDNKILVNINVWFADEQAIKIHNSRFRKQNLNITWDDRWYKVTPGRNILFLEIL